MRDAEQVRFGLIGQPAGVVGLDMDVHSGAGGETLRQPTETGFQSEIVQDSGPQQLRHLAHIANGFIHQVEAIREPAAVLAWA